MILHLIVFMMLVVAAILINLTLDILINAVVVLLLVLSYYLFKNARILAGEDS